MTEDNMTEKSEERLGVARVEIKVTYEDGFSTKFESPDMIVFQPTTLKIVTPGGRPPMAKNVAVEALGKTRDMMKKFLEDVEATIPTEEEINKAKADLAAHAAANARADMPSGLKLPSDLATK